MSPHVECCYKIQEIQNKVHNSKNESTNKLKAIPRAQKKTFVQSNMMLHGLYSQHTNSRTKKQEGEARMQSAARSVNLELIK